MKLNSASLLTVAIISFLAGCVTVEPPVKKEPAIIAVRNLSNDDLRIVYLSGIAVQQNAAVRFGSVSPVPRGVTQSVVRARNAPALPAEILVRWTDKNDYEFRQRVSISELLTRSSGRNDEVIVFAIQSDQTVVVSLEYGN